MPKTVAVALGTFDGLHKAHKAVLECALNQSTDEKICVTFPYPPKMEVGKKELLLTQSQKEKMLYSMGFDKVINLDFKKVKDLGPQDFLDYLVKTFSATHFCVGYNYRFGCHAKGDAEFLKNYCSEKGLTAIITDGIKCEGTYISSSSIRKFLKEGKPEMAAEFLGRNFSFTSKVISGDRRGRTIGVPTINQELPKGLVEVLFGVYFSTLKINNKSYKAVTNIGIRPTYKLEKPMAETHIIGFEGDLYAKEVTVELVKYLRNEKQFRSLESLTSALKEDIEQANSLEVEI